MKTEGFEALADAVLLIVILLIASIIILGHPRGGPREEGVRYAEETRLALFRTTLDGLFYTFGGEIITVPNGTTVETGLRLQVHLLEKGTGAYDFTAANARIVELARRLVRPGYAFALLGGVLAGHDLLHLPSDIEIPREHFASTWTYPSLDRGTGNTRLAVVLWLSPPR